jgi:NADH-quinone oxidoreductase subunit J
MGAWIVFVIGAAMTLLGGLGVVVSKHPVHAALLLVQTLFGVAVLFVAQGAHFLAAVQVIVYAGAVVVLFLFVIMLIGVDRTEDISFEPLKGQRPLAAIVALLAVVELIALITTQKTFGGVSPKVFEGTNVEQVSSAVFTDYLFAFEITSVLLVIAVIGAVVLARRPPNAGAKAAAKARATANAAANAKAKTAVG